jgi:hypothetical protein
MRASPTLNTSKLEVTGARTPEPLTQAYAQNRHAHPYPAGAVAQLR